MSTFFPIGPCCLQGTILPGEPVGVLEPANGTRKVTRYHAKPTSGPVVDDKKAIVLLYDIFGYKIPNAKLMADRFAERLKLNVFVPDYIPNGPGPEVLDPVVESFPGQYKDRSWLGSIGAVIKALRIIPYVPKVLNGSVIPLCEQACDDLKAEGYTTLGGVGYCRGGSVLIHLMSKGANSPVTCGVIIHPSPESISLYEKITLPTRWLMASDDMRFKEKQLEEVRTAFKGKDSIFDMTIYPETVHGFAARPNLGHEPTKKAFEECGEATIDFFEKHLLD